LVRLFRTTFIGSLATAIALLMVPVASASIWTTVNSGTTDNISALAYTGSGRLVFVTSSGKAFRQTAGGFVQGTGIAPGAIFTDVAFAPDGVNGVAVGNSGVVYHTSNGGASWAPVNAGTFPGVAGAGACSGVGPVTAVPVSNYNLESVHFATPSTVYATGAGGIILKSTTSGAAFAETNHRADGTCKASSGAPFGDSQWINDQTGYIFDDGFGFEYAVTDGLATNTAAPRGEGLDPFGNRIQTALDKVNANRLWAVLGGDSLGPYASTNGGETWDNLYTTDELGRSSACCQSLADIAFAGGTVVAVGSSGAIDTSIDGKRFFLQRAADSGPNVTESWDAVDLYDASHAAVGGAGGQLIETNAANTIPDFTPPTGRIVGPSTGLTAQALTFTANVSDEPGGSGIDPNGFSWTSNGLPSATGSTATLTFPAPGTYTIGLSFRDRAGNRAAASTNVTITSPSGGRKNLPAPTFSFRGPGNQLTATRVGRTIEITIHGSVTPPPSVGRAQGCAGRVVLTIARGRDLLTTRTVPLKTNCRFSTLIFLFHSQVGNATSLRLSVHFRGNRVLAPRTTSFIVTINQRSPTRAMETFRAPANARLWLAPARGAETRTIVR
jgi:photosystem II stability/assembly factor-like uncharacterized protein